LTNFSSVQNQDFFNPDNIYSEATLLKKLKHIRIGTSQILLVFEVWKLHPLLKEMYDYSGYLMVDDNGHPYDDGQIRQFCTRLNFSDKVTWDPVTSTVYILSSDSDNYSS
jgi:hypothetical protein